MSKYFTVLALCILMLSTAACSTVKKDRKAEDPPAYNSAISYSVTMMQSTTVDPSNIIQAAHITFNLPAGWKIDKGAESFAFHQGDASVGGLDCLGYSDTIDDLLPNGADVESKTELSGVPVKAVEAKLSLDGGTDGKKEEYHIYFFLTEQKAVYDLHFNAELVQEVEAIHIAQTAMVK